MGRSPIPPCCKLPPPSRTNPTELPPALDEHSEQSEPNSHPSSDMLSRIALELEYKAWLRVPETQGTDVTGSTDLLAWWKMNKIQFPTISKFNQKVSCNTCIIYPIRTSVFKGEVNKNCLCPSVILANFFLPSNISKEDASRPALSGVLHKILK